MLTSHFKPSIVVILVAVGCLSALVIFFRENIDGGLVQPILLQQCQRYNKTSHLDGGSDKAVASLDAPKAEDGALTYGSMTSSPRILQTTMLFTGMNNNISDRCLQSHLDQGAKQGYKMSVLRTEFMRIDENKKEKRKVFSEIIWDKPLYILSTLVEELAKPEGERAEWIVYVDIDTILLNPSISWSIFLPPPSHSQIHFLGSHDWASFNAGVFVIRVTPWSVRFLNAAIAIPSIRPDLDLKNCIDQNAMKWVLSQDDFKEHVVYQPHHWWNNLATPWKPMREVRTGDMLVHFAGSQKFGDKTAMIGKWLDGEEGPQGQRDIDLAKTTYEPEIKEFWKRHEEARKALHKAQSFIKKNKDKVNDALGEEVVNQIEALEEVVRDFFYKPEAMKDGVKELEKARIAADKSREPSQ